jgi:structural maintenance of chromosome 3 (chondroitin sulfate proteoglycan 6)
VQSAYVEVVFDNSDGRFHNSGKDDFTLRRTIGLKKDEFSMDRKNATRREVNEMLEAAGLSRSNPFYIGPQGRVATLTNMKDEERLNMLKEISGSSVYEKRRADSLKLMNDTDKSCERIDSLVADINTRLDELEGEKSELEAYNKNDRERRAILHRGAPGVGPQPHRGPETQRRSRHGLSTGRLHAKRGGYLQHHQQGDGAAERGRPVES